MKKHFYKILVLIPISVMIFVSCHTDHMSLNQIDVVEGKFTKALSIPSEVSGANTLLEAKSNSMDLISGNTSVLGYSGSILGPTIRIKSGKTASVIFSNRLSEASNIHWHGLMIPANMDGHPGAVIPANGNFKYEFPVQQRAGMYWYHPHAPGRTANQVTLGLAGLFIVNDDAESRLNLPSGKNEIPLVIQDKRIKNGKDITYAPAPMDIMSGYFGDHVLINGVHAPVHKVSSLWYRLRVLNGSTARVYNLALSNRASFFIIGSDGGLLKNPESVQSVLLAPGERADILVDFKKLNVGTEIYLESNTFDGGIQGSQSFKMVKFIVEKSEDDPFILPSVLSDIPSTAPGISKILRTFDIANVGHGSGHGGGHGGGAGHTINNLTFDMNRIDVTAKSGDVETWVFDNSKGDDLHPMHIHGVQFQVIKREGGRCVVTPLERGWKDTVLCLPGEKVTVIITVPNHKGLFVFHCHNLEHEDDGMMLNYEIQ
jgi:blue copper oxidase